MGGITVFDPHLNQSVPLSQVHPSGSNASIELFNPFNFISVFVENQQNSLTGQQLPYAPCVYCYFPLSGTYCTLNRILFLVEVIFALVTLFLDYIWLSSVAVAAVLNYTTIAAIHWIVLQCVSGNSVLDLDNGATSSIIEVGILLAYPLLQWSRLLRQKEWANTRYIIACWAILLCLTSVTAQHRDSFSAVGTSQNYWPAAEVFFTNFTVGTSFKNGPWYNDTVNALVLDVTEGHYQSLGDCTFAIPYPVSALREGQALTPAPHLLHFIHTNSFSGAVEAFIAFSVITTIATVAATLHGRHTTGYVRAKLYLWLSKSGKGEWRRRCALVLALFYYVVHFLVGIFSIPLAVVVFVINEVELEYYPGIDKNAYIGQWYVLRGQLKNKVLIHISQGSVGWRSCHLLSSGHEPECNCAEYLSAPTLGCALNTSDAASANQQTSQATHGCQVQPVQEIQDWHAWDC